jgi:prolyl-tRNA synthetase
MRTRIFLRTSEFLWQEGHTAHADEQDALDRTSQMLDIYADLSENYLAMPVIKGRKSASERFPGAVDTLCIEAMMQDRKALQAGTSHFLGQNFAKASGIKFQSANETEEFAWTTSWGVSTRLIGGLIMSHGDDDGIILPPRVASSHVVLMPIIRKPDDQAPVMEYVNSLAKELQEQTYHYQPIQVEIDTRDIGGARNWEWIKKGIPLRVEIGPRDIAEDAVFMARRDKKPNEKLSLKRSEFVVQITSILDDIQTILYDRAKSHLMANTITIDDNNAFYDYFTPKHSEKPEIHGGFASCHWCGSSDCEAKIKEDLSVTIRVIPFDNKLEDGNCICCGKASKERAIFAKAY